MRLSVWGRHFSTLGPQCPSVLQAVRLANNHFSFLISHSKEYELKLSHASLKNSIIKNVNDNTKDHRLSVLRDPTTNNWTGVDNTNLLILRIKPTRQYLIVMLLKILYGTL
ncbi:jg4172 [Pararge aegeria aegeria]|uniref:Jg4172 protein n=1 Tax=Pararge aegeria aegeria TaxID=348720 RepID=A0A8S4SHX5_9NEOP|nr:jg4172 [Pararge aegeria aegeria]